MGLGDEKMSTNFKITDQGLDQVPGFRCLGKRAGLKKQGKDLAVLYSETLCQAAAVYTQNKVKGAPLYVTREHLQDGQAQAVVVNSGNSNVATGPKGLDDAEQMTALVAEELQIRKQDVLVASTGVIGKALPMEKIRAGIQGLGSDLARYSSSADFAEAIITTDTVKKQICIQAPGFTIAGAAKGSGMIHPNLATMLVFIATDALLPSSRLQQMLQNAVADSFNMLSVDLDASTSDMVLVMANGLAGPVDESVFSQALNRICLELAKMIARDGEGATKLLVVDVLQAGSDQDARIMARAVADSTLLKCAIFGHDPNWGRILCAMGNTTAAFDQERLNVGINGQTVFCAGREIPDFDKEQISNMMQASKEINVSIDLNLGSSRATAYGCDLSYEYVKINAEYTT
jgi:glutamate N-acetyltransferase/amino-acid N-acetyltransferase